MDCEAGAEVAEAGGAAAGGGGGDAVRDARAGDAVRIAAIYNEYVRESTCTFEEEDVSPAEMAARLAAVRATGHPWLVMEHEVPGDAGGPGGQAVIGYAYATQWKGRAGYRHAAELSAYVDGRALRRGVGGRLCRAVLARLRARTPPVWTVLAGVALPSARNEAFYEGALGMRKVAHLERVGVKFGRVLDVGYWQLHLTDAPDAPDAPASPPQGRCSPR